MFSIFQKKKEPLMSYAPNRSVAPNRSTAPNMSVAPKTGQSSARSSYAPTNPLSRFGQESGQGRGLNAIQSVFRPTTASAPTFRSQASTAPQQNQSKMIQGSGMTSSYMSNPTNFRTSAPAPAPIPPKVEAPTQRTFTPNEVYTQNMEKLAGQQTDFVNRQQAGKEERTKSKYQTLKEMISGQLAPAEGNFNQFRDDSNADVEALRATGERQKGQADDYYGEAQRDAAKSLRDTQGQNQRTFAALGTLDSRGEGSFQQATENTSSDFNRFTQQTLKAKADRFAEIDTTVSGAERQAIALIRQESVKLEDLKKKIQFALINNDQAMANELSDIASNSEGLILSIQEAVMGMKYQADLEKYKLDMQSNEKLSPEFLQTGQPQNEQDYTWKLNNAKEYGEAFPNLAGGQASAGKQEVVDAIKDLMSSRGGLKQVVGYGSYNPINRLPESDAGATRAKLERVKALVSLENASKLKGTGAISDAERALLASAATAINGNMSPEQVESELNRIMQQFGGSAPSQNQTSSRFVIAPDGQQIEITD